MKESADNHSNLPLNEEGREMVLTLILILGKVEVLSTIKKYY
jgi:hypothetical protein